MQEFITLIVLVAIFYFMYAYNKSQKAKRAEAERIRKTIICPNVNCGYTGAAKKTARGSTAVGLILCLFFLLPGIIYFVMRGGYRYSCPRCGYQIRADN